jgi:hypothetical protein
MWGSMTTLDTYLSILAYSLALFLVNFLKKNL